MKIIRFFVVVLSLWSFGDTAMAEGSAAITLEQLNQMFENMRSNPGYKKWNINGNLLWGYFLQTPTQKNFKQLLNTSQRMAIALLIFTRQTIRKLFFLHVEKIEHHSPESLNERNHEFYKLAVKVSP
ncbi:hypothetical protein ACFQ2T_04710 [Methylophilus flavus]|uniref:Uncharacterized protein n=1 Tax=Methylophilus flavus TaxID=640084 RepID=A0ABW3P9R0_9PROT